MELKGIKYSKLRDDSNKWLNIEYGEEMEILKHKIFKKILTSGQT